MTDIVEPPRETLKGHTARIEPTTSMKCGMHTTAVLSLQEVLLLRVRFWLTDSGKCTVNFYVTSYLIINCLLMLEAKPLTQLTKQLK